MMLCKNVNLSSSAGFAITENYTLGNASYLFSSFAALIAAILFISGVGQW